ncbi:MAG: ABC transporter permease subunit [Gammaproteobacteria bacterium]
MIFTIAWRECRGLFLSPLAWSILGVTQLILGYLFLSQLETFVLLQPRLAALDGAPGLTDLVIAPLFANAAMVCLLVIPLMTMRLVAGERRNGTLPLLYSAPLSASEIVLGKYLGIVLFLLVLVALILLMPLSLLMGGSLDPGKLASGLLGMFLLLASFAAIGLFMSTLTGQPVVAAVATFGVLLGLWIVDWAGNHGETADDLLRYLSALRHYESLLQGLVRSEDLVYFALLIATFLILGIRRLDAERRRG